MDIMSAYNGLDIPSKVGTIAMAFTVAAGLGITIGKAIKNEILGIEKKNESESAPPPSPES